MPLPRLLLAALVAVIIGYYYGNKHSTQKWKLIIIKSENDNLKRIQQLEQKSLIEVNAIEAVYVDKIKDLEIQHGNVITDFGRLRVKTCPNNLPTSAHTAPRIDAAPSPKRVERIEINLDRIATRIIKLGSELDNCGQKVNSLQQLIKSYAN